MARRETLANNIRVEKAGKADPFFYTARDFRILLDSKNILEFKVTDKLQSIDGTYSARYVQDEDDDL